VDKESPEPLHELRIGAELTVRARVPIPIRDWFPLPGVSYFLQRSDSTHPDDRKVLPFYEIFINLLCHPYAAGLSMTLWRSAWLRLALTPISNAKDGNLGDLILAINKESIRQDWSKIS
jgi:hypothetical protein